MKAKKPMKVTPANVSRVLSAANHAKRHAYPSAIRGWKNYSSGFRVDQSGDILTVRYMVDGHYDPAPAEAKRARVESYIPALAQHFACEVIEKDGVCAVKVSEQVTQSAPARTGGVEV